MGRSPDYRFQNAETDFVIACPERLYEPNSREDHIDNHNKSITHKETKKRGTSITIPGYSGSSAASVDYNRLDFR